MGGAFLVSVRLQRRMSRYTNNKFKRKRAKLRAENRRHSRMTGTGRLGWEGYREDRKSVIDEHPGYGLGTDLDAAPGAGLDIGVWRNGQSARPSNSFEGV